MKNRLLYKTQHILCELCWACLLDVAVKHGNKHSCAVYGGQPVRADGGYLPITVSTHGTGVVANSVIGGPGCPWILQVHKGQAINLTIINFNQQVCFMCIVVSNTIVSMTYNSILRTMTDGAYIKLNTSIPKNKNACQQNINLNTRQ